MRETLKEAMVEAAILDLESKRAQVSNANVADKLGLSRRTVSDLRSKSKPVRLRTESSVPAGVLLKIWHNDPRYLDENGRPKDLDIEPSTEGISLLSLAKEAKCSAEIDGVIESLENAGAVEVDGGKARVKSRTYIMNPVDENTATYFGIAGSNLLSTLVHNTSSNNDAPFFERTTWVSGLNRSVYPRFSELVSETSVPFLELLDDWLTHRQGQIGYSQKTNDDEVLGVGIYVFNRKDKAG
jgi:hypothetical protein